jgi:hypothetical protein
MKTSGFVVARQLARGIHQRVEAAAEAAARDFLRRIALAAQQLRVHESAGLVIRDEAHLEALIAQMPRQDGRRWWFCRLRGSRRS